MLRRLARTDLREFQAYRHDPELGQYQGWSPMSEEEATAFLDEMNLAPFPSPGKWIQLGISEAASGRLIGDIGIFLDPDLRHAEIGFTLAHHAQGRGLATKAVREAIDFIFANIQVEEVIGITDARNAASIRLLERAGMRRRKTTNAMFRGEPCVEFIYALHRTDWLLLPGKS